MTIRIQHCLHLRYFLDYACKSNIKNLNIQTISDNLIEFNGILQMFAGIM